MDDKLTTLDDWRMATQEIIDNLPADRKGIPMHFSISNHLGSGFLHMHTGEIAHEPTTNIWIAALSDTFTVHNPNVIGGKSAEYRVVVGYYTDFTPAATSGAADGGRDATD